MPRTALGKDAFVRVLMYGEPGVGKTFAWLDMCRKMPESTFHVIDVDAGVNETLREFPVKDREDMLRRISYYLCNSWEDVKESFETMKVEIKPNDWIVLEQLGQLWDMAQEYYTREVFGTDLGEFYTQIRAQLIEQKKAGKDSQARLDGWRDWSVIKKLHNQDFLEILTKRFNCKGIILTASAKEVQDDPRFESEDNIDIFGKYGYKPEGEKHNIYRVDCVLLLTKDKNKGFWVKSPKVRGMPEFTEKIPTGKTAWDVYAQKRAEAIQKAGGILQQADIPTTTPPPLKKVDDSIFG